MEEDCCAHGRFESSDDLVGGQLARRSFTRIVARHEPFVIGKAFPFLDFKGFSFVLCRLPFVQVLPDDGLEEPPHVALYFEIRKKQKWQDEWLKQTRYPRQYHDGEIGRHGELRDQLVPFPSRQLTPHEGCAVGQGHNLHHGVEEVECFPSRAVAHVPIKRNAGILLFGAHNRWTRPGEVDSNCLPQSERFGADMGIRPISSVVKVILGIGFFLGE